MTAHDSCIKEPTELAGDKEEERETGLLAN